MNKEEMIKKLQELRAELKTKQLELIKGTLKNTSSLRLMKREIASLMSKLNTAVHGS